MAVAELSLASKAMDAVVDMLAEAGVEATADAGAFHPRPVGVIVGPPALVARGLAFRTYELAVNVVSGDPFSSRLAVDRALALADEVAIALRSDTFRPTAWRSTANAEPRPAIEVVVTVTLKEEA